MEGTTVWWIGVRGCVQSGLLRVPPGSQAVFRLDLDENWLERDAELRRRPFAGEALSRPG